MLRSKSFSEVLARVCVHAFDDHGAGEPVLAVRGR